MFTSRPSVVVLSRGSTWNPRPWDPPYTVPSDVVGGAWPDGSTAQAIFYDTAGGQLCVVDGTVSPTGIAFTAGPGAMDLVPNGASFEIFVADTYGDPYQIRYGRVVRREAEFLQAPPVTVTAPVAFADSWPTTGMRSAWIRMAGTTIVNDNSGIGHPNGAGSPLVLLGESDNAIRWFRPLNGDGATVTVNLLDLHSYIIAGFARLHVILCADVAFSSWVGCEFECTLSGITHVNKIRFKTGSGPTTMTPQGGDITHSIGNNEYTIGYSDGSKTISVYQGTDLTPLGSWPDSDGIVPHGPGFRYLGLCWQTSGVSSGLEVTRWAAADA